MIDLPRRLNVSQMTPAELVADFVDGVE